MSSGSAVPTGDITELQGVYDFVVDYVGCSGADDTLACLRTVSPDKLAAAANNMSPPGTSYVVSHCFPETVRLTTHALFQDLAMPTMPRADGLFLQDRPLQLLHRGKIADVPLIIGIAAFYVLDSQLNLLFR